MKEQIRQLRVEIDGLAQLCEGMDPYKDNTPLSVLAYPSENSEEIKEAIKSLKLSKAWLGKVLESLGSENPYGSGYKTVEDIVPETDKAKIVCGIMGVDGETPRLKAVDTFTLNGKIMSEYSQMSHIEKVDWLRTEIKQLENIVLEINGGKLNQRTYSEYEEKLQWNAYSYLQEARFWLGFELGRIRDESK